MIGGCSNEVIISWSINDLFRREQQKVIVDPFISNNPKCDLNIETVQVDYIVLTHGHFDHFGDVVELAKKTGATVIGSAEMADYLSSYHGVENVHGMNIGGKANFDFGSVKFVQAFHSSSFTHENGIPVYLGMPMGIVFEVEGKQFIILVIQVCLVTCHLLRNVIQLMYVLYQLEIILRWVLMMQVMLLMNLLNQNFCTDSL